MVVVVVRKGGEGSIGGQGIVLRAEGRGSAMLRGVCECGVGFFALWLWLSGD